MQISTNQNFVQIVPSSNVIVFCLMLATPGTKDVFPGKSKRMLEPDFAEKEATTFDPVI